MNEPWSLGLVVLRTAQAALAAVLLGPLGAHLGVLPPLGGLAVFAIGGAVGLVNAALGAWQLRRGGRRRAVAAILFSEAAGLILVFSSASGIGKPAINDVSTDLIEPPIFVSAPNEPGNAGRDLVYPESFKDVVRAAYPDVVTLRLEAPADAVFDRALAIAEARPDWRVTAVRRNAGTIEGVATSRVFRFQDDFVIRVRPAGGATLVDMRSKSRDGKGDLGVNGARIREFLAELSSARAQSPMSRR